VPTSRTSEPVFQAADDAQALGEPTMPPEVFARLSALIHQHSRIHLGPGKLTLLSGRLRRRRQELGLGSWDDYLRWLVQQGPDEMDTVIDLVATNHTHFFREAIQFEILQAELLGPLLERSASARRGLRCWSAGCSSGEEAFTLAMVLAEFAQRSQPDLRWQIDATDISRRALNKARQAIYELDHLGLPQPGLLEKYFQRGSGPYEGFCKVKQVLREKVQFQRLNLFADGLPLPLPQHVVFCRNVLIYFEQASQTELVRRLHDALEPGGYLIAGHSDSLLRIKHSLLSLGNGIYQRPATS
jgi:chemotaxis protein methyltransferase CheR